MTSLPKPPRVQPRAVSRRLITFYKFTPWFITAEVVGIETKQYKLIVYVRYRCCLKTIPPMWEDFPVEARVANKRRILARDAELNPKKKAETNQKFVKQTIKRKTVTNRSK